MKHGTITAYTNHECRCIACSAEWRKYQRRRRAERGAKSWPEERVVSGAAADPLFWERVRAGVRGRRGY